MRSKRCAVQNQGITLNTPSINVRAASQPRPQGFSLEKWVGKSPGDEVGSFEMFNGGSRPSDNGGGGGDGHPDPEIREAPVSKKHLLSLV